MALPIIIATAARVAAPVVVPVAVNVGRALGFGALWGLGVFAGASGTTLAFRAHNRLFNKPSQAEKKAFDELEKAEANLKAADALIEGQREQIAGIQQEIAEFREQSQALKGELESLLRTTKDAAADTAAHAAEVKPSKPRVVAAAMKANGSSKKTRRAA